MKLSTANFSMQRMIKTIISMLITTTVVLSLVHGSITVKAASYDLPYIIYINDKVYISDGIFIITADESNMTEIFGSSADLKSVNCSVVLELKYNTSLSQWQTSAIHESGNVSSSFTFYRYGTSTYYGTSTKVVTIDPGTSRSPTEYWAEKNVVTNVSWNQYEKSAVGSYSNDLTQLPQGLTESAIRDIIDQQINTSTQSGQTAQTIINNTTNQYNLYLTGNIDSKTMLENVDNNISDLNNLTPGTLLDAMQINNGLTYNQTIQDQIYNTLSASTQSLITTAVTNANSDLYQFTQGNADQTKTVARLRQRIYDLQKKVDDGTIYTTADLIAVQNAITTIQSHIDTVTGYSDLNVSVSDKSQQSDAEELELLNEMVSEMQKEEIEQPFENQQTMSDAQSVRDSIANVWINKYMVALVTMFGMLVIPCIVLRTHYRLM